MYRDSHPTTIPTVCESRACNARLLSITNLIHPPSGGFLFASSWWWEGNGKDLISQIFGYTRLMREETLTFEEIGKLRERDGSKEFVSHAEMMKKF